jgi:hypothetical protein
VEMAASPRRQGANSAAAGASETGVLLGAAGASGHPSSHYQTTGGGGGGGGGGSAAMHPLSSVAAGTLDQHRLGPHSSPGLRSMVVQSDFRKVSIFHFSLN